MSEPVCHFCLGSGLAQNVAPGVLKDKPCPLCQPAPSPRGDAAPAPRVIIEPDAVCGSCGHRGDAHEWGYDCQQVGCGCGSFVVPPPEDAATAPREQAMEWLRRVGSPESSALASADAAPAPDDNLRSRLAESEAQVVALRARAEAAELALQARLNEQPLIYEMMTREAAAKVRAEAAERKVERLRAIIDGHRCAAGVPGERTPPPDDAQKKNQTCAASAPCGTVATSASAAGCDGKGSR